MMKVSGPFQWNSSHPQLKLPDIYPKVDDEATIIVTYPHAQAIIQAS